MGQALPAAATTWSASISLVVGVIPSPHHWRTVVNRPAVGNGHREWSRQTVRSLPPPPPGRLGDRSTSTGSGHTATFVARRRSAYSNPHVRRFRCHASSWSCRYGPSKISLIRRSHTLMRTCRVTAKPVERLPCPSASPQPVRRGRGQAQPVRPRGEHVVRRIRPRGLGLVIDLWPSIGYRANPPGQWRVQDGQRRTAAQR